MGDVMDSTLMHIDKGQTGEDRGRHQRGLSFNIVYYYVKNEKNNGLLAGVSFPPSSRAPSRFSRA